MKKSVIAAMTALALMGGITTIRVDNTSALRAERIQENSTTVRWETDEPFIVTGIIPSEGWLKMVYTDLGDTGRRVSHFNVVWEKEPGVGGELVSELGTSMPDWGVTAFNEKIMGTGLFVNKYEQTYTVPMTPLTENKSGVLYYYVMLNKNDAYSLYGSVDYSSCLNSPLYQDGVECRLEVNEGEASYWPYFEDVRLEMPEKQEETVVEGELTNDTENSNTSGGGLGGASDNNQKQANKEQNNAGQTTSNVSVAINSDTSGRTYPRPVANLTSVSQSDDNTRTTDQRQAEQNTQNEQVKVAPLGENETELDENKFNWWIFILITSAILVSGVIMWLFFMKKRKNEEDKTEDFVI